MATNISPTAHWRDSARSVKFFFIDGAAAFPLLLFIVHIRLWTFIFAILAMLFLTALNHYGFSIPIFFRLVRNFAAGKRRLVIPWWMD
jgi:intracellular multiplication protein IcmT